MIALSNPPCSEAEANHFVVLLAETDLSARLIVSIVWEDPIFRTLQIAHAHLNVVFDKAWKFRPIDPVILVGIHLAFQGEIMKTDEGLLNKGIASAKYFGCWRPRLTAALAD